MRATNEGHSGLSQEGDHDTSHLSDARRSKDPGRLDANMDHSPPVGPKVLEEPPKHSQLTMIILGVDQYP